MPENIIEVQIALVNTQGRFRKDFGDLKALADSIKEIGLLQPIGIDSGYRLVFGERRLRAYQMLGRDTIPVRFVNLDSLIKGEFAENDCREDFRPSEKVAIGQAIEEELKQRHGGDRTSEQAGKNSGLNEQKGDTRDLAAKAAGFGNGKTYEQAKAVVATTTPELIAAMDRGDISVSAAAQVAKLPASEQVAAIKDGTAKAIAKKSRPTGKPKTGPKADATRQEIKAAKERGVSMLCTYARLLVTAISAADELNQQERELLVEVAGVIQSKGVLQ